MQEDFFEQCWFVYGIRVGTYALGFLKYHSKGTAASVEFDWEKAMSPLCIGWYHSHPGKKFLTPSEIDNKTMRSWIKGLYKPRICGIFCHGEQRCYCYVVSAESTRRQTIVERLHVDSVVKGAFFLGRIRKDLLATKV